MAIATRVIADNLDYLLVDNRGEWRTKQKGIKYQD